MPTIKALPKRTYGLEDVVWRISRWLFSAWPFLISEWDYFSYSESQCCLTHPIKFLLDTIYTGWKMLFEEYQDVCLVLISEWNDLIHSESPCCKMHPNKFLLKRIYGLEEVVWKIPRRLFSAWPSFVSKWNEKAFTSLFLASSIQSSFCSWGHMVWRRMLFDKYQDCCLVLGHPDILFYLSLHFCLDSAQ